MEACAGEAEPVEGFLAPLGCLVLVRVSSTMGAAVVESGGGRRLVVAAKKAVVDGSGAAVWFVFGAFIVKVDSRGLGVSCVAANQKFCFFKKKVLLKVWPLFPPGTEPRAPHPPMQGSYS